jgi:hypothetical protein
VVHYDSLRPFKRQLPGYSADSDPFLLYLESQEKLEIITVLAPLTTLRTRLIERHNRLSKETLPKVRAAKLNKVLDLYNKPSAFLEILQQWLAYCQHLKPTSHHFYLNSNDFSSCCLATQMSLEDLNRFLIE